MMRKYSGLKAILVPRTTPSRHRDPTPTAAAQSLSSVQLPMTRALFYVQDLCVLVTAR